MPVPVRIEVIKVPKGEAPEAIRKAWIGITMPAMRLESAPGTQGVLSERYMPDRGLSYAVLVTHAVTALRCAGKTTAADWWVDHVAEPDALVFGAEECKELTTA